MIRTPGELRVAVVGPGATRARDVLATLAAAGYHGRGFLRPSRLLESKREWCATILLWEPDHAVPHGELAALAELALVKPLIIAASSIDMTLVRRAAELGARDVVLRDDSHRLIESLQRAASETTEEDDAAPVEAVSQQLMRRIFDLTPNYVSVRDGGGRYVIVSQSYADLYGTTVEQMNGRPVSSFAPDAAEAEREISEDAGVLLSHRSRFETREVLDSSGRRRLLQTVKRPVTLEDGRTYVLSIATDVTRPQRAETTLDRTNAFLKNVLETISDAVFALDVSGNFTLANRRLAQITGYGHHQLIGMPFARIFAADSQAEVHRAFQAAVNAAHAERRFEAQVAHVDGLARVMNCSLSPLKAGDTVIGIVGSAQDVTERRAAEQRIEHLAYHDPLTNLPNRRLLSDRLHMAMSQAQRDERRVAVLFVDLDRFKSINDSLGHRIGDALLQELGPRFRHCVRSGDTVARMGGDEFVFLLPAISRIDEAALVARKILDAIRMPFSIEGREFVVTACIGISIYPDHAQDAETLIKQADTALFESKRGTGDSFQIFDESMGARSLNRFNLENDLRRAISQNELMLMYQPILEMRTERIIAVEALVRWRHPERGILMPDDFIRVAEETGLISPLGEWVLREACRQNGDWQRRGILAAPVAVNISARQLDGNLLGAVERALADAALPAAFLDLELTESILMESAAGSSLRIDALKELGVGISVDDFGTGYSSLGYLDRFRVDSLKIDRSFMPHDGPDSGGGVIAATILSMARSLGIEVIAEGVETSGQRDFLLARGCTRAQGHFYWPAMSAQALEVLARGDTRDGILT